MEFHLSFSSSVAAILFIVVISILVKRNKVNKRAPPEAKGAWPIIGHLHLLGESTVTHRLLGDMAETYGPVYTLKLGVHRALVVSDAKIAKECLATNDKVFASRPKSKAAEIIGCNYALIGYAPYGDYWRKIRKIITLEVLSHRGLEMLAHVRVSELKASIQDIYDAWVKNKESDLSSDMVMVEMSGWIGNMILNTVLRIISGKRLPLTNEEGVRSRNAVRKFFELAGTYVVSDFIPFMSYFDLGGHKRKMKIAAKDMDNIINGWLKDSKRAKEIKEQPEGKQVFIDVLISILQGGSEEVLCGFDHDTIIKAICQGILIAASDSTSATITWALSLLLNNPKVLKIAQDEIDTHVGSKRLVEKSDLKNLVYLDAIIKETMRLYPTGPLLFPHESVEDCTVSGYNVPKGTRLFVNVWKIQRDPNIWPDPCKFQPERFLTSHKNIDVKGKHYELLPFGSGRRMCPGVSFALPTMGLTLASLIQCFVLQTPSNKPVDMNERSGIANTKATPLDVLLAPRLSSNLYA